MATKEIPGIVTTKVWVTFSREDFHCRPNAPEEVAFLRNVHRHIFHGKVSIDVNHDDRDIEFILLKRDLEAHVENFIVPKENFKSCEMIARDIFEYILDKYEPEQVSVEVSEDGENGAILEFIRA